VLDTQKDPLISPIKFSKVQGGNCNEKVRKFIISQLVHNEVVVASHQMSQNLWLLRLDLLHHLLKPQFLKPNVSCDTRSPTSSCMVVFILPVALTGANVRRDDALIEGAFSCACSIQLLNLESH
jgi:hypothetical protein